MLQCLNATNLMLSDFVPSLLRGSVHQFGPVCHPIMFGCRLVLFGLLLVGSQEESLPPPVFILLFRFHNKDHAGLLGAQALLQWFLRFLQLLLLPLRPILWC